MPRANDNRKPVGTEHCDTCGTLARFYQVQKGSRTGYLYRRCECGCNQTSGAAQQVRWLETMSRTAEPMIPHPLQSRLEKPESAGSEPAGEVGSDSAEPRVNAEVNRESEPKKTGLIGLAILCAAGAVALLT